MWTKTTYHCFARTASGGTCWSQVPFDGKRCWHHRGQKTKREEDQPKSSTSDHPST